MRLKTLPVVKSCSISYVSSFPYHFCTFCILHLLLTQYKLYNDCRVKVYVGSGEKKVTLVIISVEYRHKPYKRGVCAGLKEIGFALLDTVACRAIIRAFANDV